MARTDPTQRVTLASPDTLLNMLEALPSALFFLDDSGIILYANASAQALIEATPEEIIGEPLVQTLWWSPSPGNHEKLGAAMARASQGETVPFQARIQPREGRDRALSATITRHVDADHRSYLIFSGIAITAHKCADIHALIDAIPQFVWTARADGSTEYSNQRWRDYTGLSVEEWLQCLHPDDRRHGLDAWRTAVQTGMPYEMEQRVQQGSTGVYRWFLTRAMPVHDDTGQIVKWFGTCTDIDEQKGIEEALRQSREELSVLMETIPQLVWIAQPDGFVEDGNQHLFTYLNLPLERCNGDQWLHFVHPDDREKTWETWQKALRTGHWHEVEHRVCDGKTGNYRWFLTRALPSKDAQGTILKWSGTSTDINDQKRIEQALRQSQERIRALIDSNLIGIVTSEGEEEVAVEANEAFLQMSGYGREDLDQRRLTRARITLPKDAPLFEHAHQELVACGQHTPFETELVCKDGSRLPILVGGVLFQDYSRQVVSFVLNNAARKELDRRKDDFISLASHELRTPLTALKLQTSRLYRQLAKQGFPDSLPALARIDNQVNRLTRLVGELLDLSKIQAGRLEYAQEPVDLDQLLQETVETMQQTSATHTILLHGATHAVLVGDPDRLAEVFTNLLGNAVKYSPDAKTIEVDLRTSEETVTVSIRDHGMGIPQELHEKIFERFTRGFDPSQKAFPGLGLGLYIVAEIVKRHGGTVSVESQVGEGSTFHVTFPLKGQSIF